MNESNLVTKSNEIIEASYKLSLNEQRVLLGCISQIDSRNEITHEDEFVLLADDFSKTFGVSKKKAYEEMKEGVEKLQTKTFKIMGKKGKKDGRVNWTDKAYYVETEGKIIVHFGASAIPYISSLSKSFTSYRLKHVTNLSSIYSLRLYELLIRWRKIGVTEFKLDSLRETLQIDPKEYKRMYDFKRKVLHLAIDQINKHTDINCYYKDIKKGRKIIGFRFHFGDNCPTQIELEEAIASIPQ